VDKEKRILRQKTLLDTALDCFSRDSWDTVSVGRIAKLAGIAKGTVYLHFDSKDEIFAHLAIRFHVGLANDCKQGAYRPDSNPGNRSELAQLQSLIHTLFAYCSQERRYRHIVQYTDRAHFIDSINPELAGQLSQAKYRLREQLAKCLRHCIDEGTLENGALNNVDAMLWILSGARDEFWFSTQTDEKPFIDRVSGYILSSAGRRLSKVKQPPQSTPAIVLDI